jgi:hypothetical protein
MVVVVIVPVLLIVPAMLVFIPPFVVLVPAALARLMQFMSRVFGLGTLWAMVFDGFVQSMIGADNAMLALVVVGVRARDHRQNCECRQGGERQQQLGYESYVSGIAHAHSSAD